MVPSSQRGGMWHFCRGVNDPNAQTFPTCGEMGAEGYTASGHTNRRGVQVWAGAAANDL